MRPRLPAATLLRMTSILNTENEFLHRVIREAGAVAMQHFGHVTRWDEKAGRGDIVTAADHAVEDLVLKRLQEEFPTHNLLTEERGWVRQDQSAPLWILDPVDGTRNFAMGIPMFCVSLGCMVDGDLLLGAVYDPVHDELFSAVSGQGAFLNGKPIHVSSAPDLEDALLYIGWTPKREDTGRFNSFMARASDYTSYFRRLGSAAIVMSYIAAGRLDGYIQAGISAWDCAAGVLLVQEAGGRITDFQGRKLDILAQNLEMVAANPTVHDLLLRDVLADT